MYTVPTSLELDYEATWIKGETTKQGKEVVGQLTPDSTKRLRELGSAGKMKLLANPSLVVLEGYAGKIRVTGADSSSIKVIVRSESSGIKMDVSIEVQASGSKAPWQFERTLPAVFGETLFVHYEPWPGSGFITLFNLKKA
ncbi:MAG TPA: hypothetical protein VEX38_10680 [Fimbriimonadaceae bacterium]|nr:hypothetical protein [Fimbriimonadaceae bacterium]